MKNYSWRYRKYGAESKKIINTVDEIKDISTDTITECLSWKEYICSVCSDELEILHLDAERKREAYSKLLAEKAYQKASELLNEINDIEQLLDLPGNVASKERICSAMENQIFVVEGEAGGCNVAGLGGFQVL